MLDIDLRKRLAIKKFCCAGAVLYGSSLSPASFAANDHGESSHGAKTGLTPRQALVLLKAGNLKYVQDNAEKPRTGHERRSEIAFGQAPVAVIVGCSDSRVPPELLFSSGLGELFVIRVAGNTVDNVAEGSIEYAVAQLGAPLIVVMGHERCGAVAAAVSVVENNATFPGTIGKMIEPIVPAVLSAQSKLKKSNDGATPSENRQAWVDAAVEQNVARVVDQLRSTGPLMTDAISSGKLMIVGARYDLDDGQVHFFEG